MLKMAGDEMNPWLTPLPASDNHSVKQYSPTCTTAFREGIEVLYYIVAMLRNPISIRVCDIL